MAILVVKHSYEFWDTRLIEKCGLCPPLDSGELGPAPPTSRVWLTGAGGPQSWVYTPQSRAPRRPCAGEPGVDTPAQSPREPSLQASLSSSWMPVRDLCQRHVEKDPCGGPVWAPDQEIVYTVYTDRLRQPWGGGGAIGHRNSLPRALNTGTRADTYRVHLPHDTAAPSASDFPWMAGSGGHSSFGASFLSQPENLFSINR